MQNPYLLSLEEAKVICGWTTGYYPWKDIDRRFGKNLKILVTIADVAMLGSQHDAIECIKRLDLRSQIQAILPHIIRGIKNNSVGGVKLLDCTRDLQKWLDGDDIDLLALMNQASEVASEADLRASEYIKNYGCAFAHSYRQGDDASCSAHSWSRSARDEEIISCAAHAVMCAMKGEPDAAVGYATAAGAEHALLGKRLTTDMVDMFGRLVSC